MATFDFVWVSGGLIYKVVFASNPVYVMLRLSVGVVELELGQSLEYMLLCI